MNLMMIRWDVSWLLILSRLQEFRAIPHCCPPCDYQVIPCSIIFQAVVALIAIGPRDFLAKWGMEAEICETSWQNKGHVLVTVKWKCSSAEVNMGAVQRRSLSPVCPMGSCRQSSGPMMGTQKLDAGYPERNEDGISRRLMERPSVICKHIMVMSKQPEWNLQPWTDFAQRNKSPWSLILSQWNHWTVILKKSRRVKVVKSWHQGWWQRFPLHTSLPATRNYSPSKLNRVNCRFSLRSHGFSSDAWSSNKPHLLLYPLAVQ